MNPWPITPLSSKDLDFIPVNYDFTSLAGTEQADLPGLETAIDATLADFILSVADQTGLFAAMDGDLLDAASIPGEVDAVEFNRTAAELATAATAGDQLFSDYTSLVGASAPPAPSNTIPIQNATGPVLTCQARQGMGPQACSSYPCAATYYIHNNSNQPQHVSKLVLVQQSDIWTASTELTDTLQPGASGKFTITATRAPGANDAAQLQFYFKELSAPAVFCVDGGVGSSGTGGSGGGSGGLRLAPAP
jgi:hypothetical protein